jgi:hypothetical protein
MTDVYLVSLYGYPVAVATDADVRDKLIRQIAEDGDIPDEDIGVISYELVPVDTVFD